MCQGQQLGLHKMRSAHYVWQKLSVSGKLILAISLSKCACSDICSSVQGDLWASSVKILMFPSPTGYMLWSFSFSLLIQCVFYRFIENDWSFSEVLNFNRLFLKLNRSSVTALNKMFIVLMVIDVAMVTFGATLLTNKWTNIVMDDRWVHPLAITLPSLVSNLWWNIVMDDWNLEENSLGK